jgi:hypothetical protein
MEYLNVQGAILLPLSAGKHWVSTPNRSNQTIGAVTAGFSEKDLSNQLRPGPRGIGINKGYLFSVGL